jgi:hypothetical protein
MIELTWMQAWELWRSGAQLSQETLWGVSILWLGRAGKIMQFAGGATVLLEIIGPANIQAFGNHLLKIASLGKVRKSLASVLGWLKNFYFNPNPSPSDLRERQFTWQEIKTEPLLFISTGISLIAVIAAWQFSPIATWWINLILAIVLLYVLQLLVAPWLAALFCTLLLAGVGAIALLIVKPIAWVLAQKMLSHAIKVLAFLLLACGFHFDLLSS